MYTCLFTKDLEREKKQTEDDIKAVNQLLLKFDLEDEERQLLTELEKKLKEKEDEINNVLN